MDEPAPTRRKRTRRTIVVLIALVVATAGSGAWLANDSLAMTYSPANAVTDYLAAQRRGDVDFMLANANYLRSDGAYSQYFGRAELEVMMALPKNTAISDVNVLSTTTVDANTRAVSVEYTWDGHPLQRSFTVHADPARVHYLFFNSWLIDIPFESIHLTLPTQPGAISVDGSQLPAGASTATVQVIPGFHKVSMGATDIYDAVSMDADGIESSPTVVLPGNVTAAARAAAASLVRTAFSNCEPNESDCIGHLYYAPIKPGYTSYFTLPGYGAVPFTKYVYSLTSDPTTNMQLVVNPTPENVGVSGVCAFTLTVDDSQKYFLRGKWKATLNISTSEPGYEMFRDCLQAKA